MREKLLSLINSNATIQTIKQELGLTSSQLAYRLFMLEFQGYAVKRKYFGNGDISLSLQNNISVDKYESIYTKESEASFRFLAISDLHYFHKNENRMVIDYAFNYCA